MMYASKINIDKTPQKIKYNVEVMLPRRNLTIRDLFDHLKGNETFHFEEREENQFGDTNMFMIIHRYKYETDDQVNARILFQEQYNRAYKKHWEKYGNE